MSPEQFSLNQLQSTFDVNTSIEGTWFNTPPYLVWGETRSSSDPCETFSAMVFRESTTLPNLVYRNSSHFDYDFCNCIVVDGDLTISGNLDLTMDDVGTPGYVYVRGDLRAENLFIREQCELIVDGSVILANALIASRWANGQFRVRQNLSSKYGYIDGFYSHVRGDIANSVYIYGSTDTITTPEHNASKVVTLEDWHVRSFDGYDQVDDDDPVFQRHIVFSDCMFEAVPYNESYDDKMKYWIERGVQVFRDPDAFKLR